MDNDIYYKIIVDEGNLKIVCMQWFDEYDYGGYSFLVGDKGRDLKFVTESNAKEYINELDIPTIKIK